MTDSKIVEIKSVQDIGTVPEFVCDMEIWENKLWIAPYLSYSNLKIYGHDIGGQGIHVAYSMNKKFESVYRLWKSPNGEKFSFTTEQPPEVYQRSKAGQWVGQVRYSDKGWALLGDTLFNGKEVRGWSNLGKAPVITWWNNNQWQNFPKQITLPRIVWMMEFYDGSYYAVTNWSQGYKERNCGNVYRWDFNNWSCPIGSDMGRATGGAMSILAADNRLFVGTRKPSEILVMDEDGDWSSLYISEGNGEQGVYSIFEDDEEHIFATAYTDTSVLLYQWNLRTKRWEIIWTRATATHENRWGVIGVCHNNDTIYLKWRQATNQTMISKLTYEEDE